MKVFILGSAIIFGIASIFFSSHAASTIARLVSHTTASSSSAASMSATTAALKNMAKSVAPRIVPRRSGERGHANHGWLDSYHTFSFASYHDSRFERFGSLRVLNEDRVAPGEGFPTHPHRDFEIFSYILGGELTHRDSMIQKGKESGKSVNDFYRMKRGDVQFTTGGTGIAHSEFNESDDEVHFLQIWALPWAKGLTPRYHTLTFSEDAKRAAFLPILSPLAARKGASAADEAAAQPVLAGTIPIHADFVMAAGIVAPGATFGWKVGATDHADAVVQATTGRKVYVHVPMTQGGKAKVRIALKGADGAAAADTQELAEGDGAFVHGVDAGMEIAVESLGTADAEVVVLDSD